MGMKIFYFIFVITILLIVSIGYFYFSSIAKMMCGPCGCGNDECGGPVTPPPQTTTFECITNQDCEPSEFNPDEVGKFFICNNQYKCTNQTAEDIESIVCSINEECPYGYECYEGSCWGME